MATSAKQTRDRLMAEYNKYSSIKKTHMRSEAQLKKSRSKILRLAKYINNEDSLYKEQVSKIIKNL